MDTVAAELCREVAVEAASRGRRINPSELWVALEHVDDLQPRLIVDLGSEPAVWWAWWSLGAELIGVSPSPVQPQHGFSGTRLPESVTELVGEPSDAATRQRVADQVAERPVDVLVLGGLAGEDAVRWCYHAYAPLVRDGGLVLVQGIEDPAYPGIGKFWSGLDSPDCSELVGETDPIGYGVVQVHRRDREHG